MLLKIPSVRGLLTTTVHNTKIVEVEKELPDVSDLVTTTVLNKNVAEVESKVLRDSYLVHKANYNVKT